MTPDKTYGWLQRALHQVAFAATSSQAALADIEDILYGSSFRHVSVERPVFITSLPRAGTTLLLQLLSGLPDFSTHTYRHMPFVLCPVLWNRLSRSFQRSATLNERAHGDGVLIGYDSPEAFEEVLWHHFWRRHYHPDRIDTWDEGQPNAEFEDFFRNHMKKIIALAAERHSPDPLEARRYLSKNNANVARLRLLTATFPDCSIVIPFRNPFDHAFSLLTQHNRFTALHKADHFSKRYMEWIGHYEFGANHRPIAFNDWYLSGVDDDPATYSYWVAYWNACYAYILDAPSERIVLVDYDQLCAEPRRVLSTLADKLGVKTVASLTKSAHVVRPSACHQTAARPVGMERIEKARQIHTELVRRCHGDQGQQE